MDDHIVDRMFVVVPSVTVAPVFLGNLVHLPRSLLAFLEAAQLFVLADMQPELVEDDAVFQQLFLKIIDLLKGASPFPFACKLFHAFNQYPAIP